MTIEDFCNLPVEERVKLVFQPVNWGNDPFWLERIKTALKDYTPLAVCFSKELINQYWELIPYKK